MAKSVRFLFLHGRDKVWRRAPAEAWRNRARRGRGLQASAIADELVNVAEVALLLLELGEEFLGVFGTAAAVGGDCLKECGFDVGGHAFGVAADVEVRAPVEPAPELGGVFADALLDVDFFLLIAGEGEVEALEGAVLHPGEELVAIEEVLGCALLAEEEPHGPAAAAGLLVLEEGAEGRDAGARANHDDGHVGRGGETEEPIGVNEEGERAAGRGALADVGGADAGAGAAVAFVLNDADGEVDFAGVEGLARRDGIKARGEAREKPEKLLRVVEFGGAVILSPANGTPGT